MGGAGPVSTAGEAALHRTLPGVEWVEGDLGDDAVAASARGRARTRSFIVPAPFAARGAPTSTGSMRRATARLVRAAASLPRAPRFLLMSSLAARMPELSDYAGSKRQGERALEAARELALDGAAASRRLRARASASCVRSFAASRAEWRRCPPVAAGRFSLLYVDDLATAVLRWLAADTGYGRIFELDDGHAGGYDWDTVLDASPDACCAGARRVRRVPVPLPAPPGRGLRPISRPRTLCRLRSHAHARQGARNLASGLVVR